MKSGWIFDTVLVDALSIPQQIAANMKADFTALE